MTLNIKPDSSPKIPKLAKAFPNKLDEARPHATTNTFV
jgi:hypothetical protein